METFFDSTCSKRLLKIAALPCYILLILATFSCSSNQKKLKSAIGAVNQTSLDTSRYTIIPEDTTVQVNNEEVQSIYHILTNVIDSLNKARDRKINPAEYKFQIVPLKSVNAQKIFWVNCFCNGGALNWKTQIYQVKDGGMCFFNTRVNLTTLTYSNLVVNSSA